MSFYNVFFPYQNVKVSNRFFFFNSLNEKDIKIDPYERTGSELAQDVKQILQDGLDEFEVTQNNQGLTIIQQALDFLKLTIEKEQEQEIAYYESQIKNNEKLPEVFRDKFHNFFSKNSEGSLEIDYLNFINLLNIFYNGIEDYKFNLTYEKGRLEEVNELIKEFKQLSARQQRIYRNKRQNKKKEDNKQDDDSFYSSFKNFLIQKLNKESKKYSETEAARAKKILDSKTVLNKIQSEFKKAYQQIWRSPELLAAVEKAILEESEKLDNIKIERIEEVTLAFLMAKFFMEFPLKDIIEMIEKNNENKEDTIKLEGKEIKTLAEEFVEKLNLTNSETNSEDFLIEDMQETLRKAIRLQKGCQEKEKLKTRFFQNISLNPDKIIGYNKGDEIEGETKKQGGIIGLTQDVIDALTPIVDKMLADKGEKLTKREIKTKNTTEKKYETPKTFFLRKLMALNIDIKDTSRTRGHHSSINYKEAENFIRELIEKKYKLIEINIRKKDNLISEFNTDKILKRIEQLRDDKNPIVGLLDGNQKADTAYLDLGEFIISSNLSDSLIDSLSEQIHKNFYYNNKINNINPHYVVTFDEKKERKNKDFSTNEFFLEGETKRRVEGLERTFNEVKEQLEKNGASAEEIEKTLMEIKNGFQISTTVKSYNKYDNDIGFHGGSLGGSLENQLKNIYEMFNLGGITLPDLDWLTFAIYNSGKRTLGNEVGVKNKIEDLLSTVAVMLMFDDAGQQAQYIKDQAIERYDKPSTKFLHLYVLNNFYFPASFILQLTYNSLAEAKDFLIKTENINSTGSRANIINDVTEHDMSGEKSHIDGRIRVTSEQDWYKTFDNNKEKVKIQVTFLAGLLDIIDSLENEMVNFTN